MQQEQGRTSAKISRDRAVLLNFDVDGRDFFTKGRQLTFICRDALLCLSLLLLFPIENYCRVNLDAIPSNMHSPATSSISLTLH